MNLQLWKVCNIPSYTTGISLRKYTRAGMSYKEYSSANSTSCIRTNRILKTSASSSIFSNSFKTFVLSSEKTNGS